MEIWGDLKGWQDGLKGQVFFYKPDWSRVYNLELWDFNLNVLIFQHVIYYTLKLIPGPV